MRRNITTGLFLLVVTICWCSCHSDSEKNIRSTEETKNQIDSIEFKQIALSFSEGKQLFRTYCNSCHYAPEKYILDQYTFDNLFERLPAPPEEYFISYISDSKSLKASGNPYAKQVDEAWNNSYEHQFKESLSNKDFSDLITYIKIAAKQRYQNKGG